MAKTYTNYDEDFKKTIVNLIESGKSISDIEREYGVNRKNIYNWKNKYAKIVTPNGNITTNNDLDKLIKENKLLKEENEILKKAVAIFTKK